MAKQKYQHHNRVLTANDLRSGDVVFWSANGWQKDATNAILLQGGAQGDELLAIGEQAEAHNIVVGSYLVAVEDKAGQRTAVELRERVRLSGPPILNAVHTAEFQEAA